MFFFQLSVFQRSKRNSGFPGDGHDGFPTWTIGTWLGWSWHLSQLRNQISKANRMHYKSGTIALRRNWNIASISCPNYRYKHNLRFQLHFYFLKR